MKKTFNLLLVKVFSAGLTYVSNALITNSFSTTEAGYYFLFTTLIIIFSGISRLGFEIQSIKVVALHNVHGEKDAIRNYINKTIVLLIIFDLIMAVPLTIVTAYFVKSAVAVYLVGVTMVCFAIKDVISAMLRGLQKYYHAGFILNSSVPLVLTILCGIFFFIKKGYNPYYFFFFGCLFSFVMGTAFLVRNKVLSFSFKDKIDLRALTKTIDVNKYLITISLMGINFLPNILVGTFLNVQSVAVFTVISRTSLIISYIYIAVESYIAPKIASHHVLGEVSEIRRLLVRLSKLSFAVSTIVVFLAIYFSKTIMHFFGKQYTEFYLLFDMMAIAQYLNVLTGSAGTFMIMTNRDVIVRNVYFFTIGGIIVLLPIAGHFGNLTIAVGVYSALIICYNVSLTLIAKFKFDMRSTFLMP